MEWLYCTVNLVDYGLLLIKTNNSVLHKVLTQQKTNNKDKIWVKHVLYTDASLLKSMPIYACILCTVNWYTFHFAVLQFIKNIANKSYIHCRRDLFFQLQPSTITFQETHNNKNNN